jgi:hypothetical protein
MIRNPIVFTQEQIAVVEGIKGREDFNSNSWGLDEVEHIKPAIRQHYTREQNTTCPYCQMQLNSERGRMWDVEHIIPRSTVENFMFHPLNLCVACVECNSAKSNKKVTNSTAKKHYPRKGFTIIHPHFDNYQEHIKCIHVGLFYFPRDSKGENTIYVCKLNRFYSYANYDDNLDDLEDLMFTLVDAMRETTNMKTRASLRAQIRLLTLKQALIE